MKWFKHFSDASRDEDIAKLIASFGGDGYMYYWRVIETIAWKLDAHNPKTSLVYSWAQWANETGLSVQKFKKISNFVSTLSLLFLEKSKESLKIDCPKLLSIKDNHTKNLQVSGKKVSLEVEVEVDNSTAHTQKRKILPDKKQDIDYSKIPKEAIAEIEALCREATGGFYQQCLDVAASKGTDTILGALDKACQMRKDKGKAVGWQYIQWAIDSLPAGYERKPTRKRSEQEEWDDGPDDF